MVFRAFRSTICLWLRPVRLGAQKFPVSPVAQLTRRARSAAVARNAVVAGDGLVADDLEDAEPVGKRPFVRFGFVQKRRDDLERPFHREAHHAFLRADEDTAAVGVAGEVGLRDANVQFSGAQRLGPYASQEQKDGVAAVHDGRGAGGPLGLDNRDSRRNQGVGG